MEKEFVSMTKQNHIVKNVTVQYIVNIINDWKHPLPFGDSMWVKRSDVEPLVKAVRKMLDEIYEFGSVVSNEYVEAAESAYISLVGDEITEQHVSLIGCTCPRFENGSKVFPMRECDGCRKPGATN